jgi:hypothetical protein
VEVKKPLIHTGSAAKTFLDSHTIGKERLYFKVHLLKSKGKFKIF